MSARWPPCIFNARFDKLLERKLIICRYIDGLIKTGYFQLPLDFHPCPLRKKYDQELVDFFDGFEYRHDLIDQIDQTVEMGIRELALGRLVPLGLRKLICYAVWGNPVDAYKWFEYCYQHDYMPHRYLPEHVVLGQLPKPKGYAEPQPSSFGRWNGYGDVRRRMARARDQGVGKCGESSAGTVVLTS